MRTCRAHGGMLGSALWWPTWEGNPKKMEICVCSGSTCATAEADPTLQSKYSPKKQKWKSSWKSAYPDAKQWNGALILPYRQKLGWIKELNKRLEVIKPLGGNKGSSFWAMMCAWRGAGIMAAKARWQAKINKGVTRAQKLLGGLLLSGFTAHRRGSWAGTSARDLTDNLPSRLRRSLADGSLPKRSTQER